MRQVAVFFSWIGEKSGLVLSINQRDATLTPEQIIQHFALHTIDRILEKDDLELGIEILKGKLHL